MRIIIALSAPSACVYDLFANSREMEPGFSIYVEKLMKPNYMYHLLKSVLDHGSLNSQTM